MSSKLETFKKIASINGITVKEYGEVEEYLHSLDYEGSDYFKKDNVSIVKALAASAQDASAIVDVSEPEMLECVMDTERLVLLIEKGKIFNSMHEAYAEAFKQKPSNYMLFVSQESKTADIEKQLISGVQGAKKLEFVVV